jgi:AbrB family looped-hinge helix DNA binding protein
MMATTVTSKGQVTIPKPVRDLLGITPGSAVVFEMTDDGRIEVRRAAGKGSLKRPASRFERLRGSAGKGLSTDEIMALTRGEA